MLSSNSQLQPELLPVLNTGLFPLCMYWDREQGDFRVYSSALGFSFAFCNGSDSKYLSLSFRDLKYLTASVYIVLCFYFYNPLEI